MFRVCHAAYKRVEIAPIRTVTSSAKLQALTLALTFLKRIVSVSEHGGKSSCSSKSS